MTTPEHDFVDPVEAAVFLIGLGGMWTTDCRCRTVTDLEQHIHADLVYEPVAGRYAVSYTDYWPEDVTDSVAHQCHSVVEAIEVALDHTCDPVVVPDGDPAP